MSVPHFDAAVIGGGANGLATAWHLARQRAGRVALIERFALAHNRGSSHGAARITRSSYGDATHVRLMRIAHEEEWPRLERDSGATLIHRCDGVFFGPSDGPIRSYAAAVAEAGAAVEAIDPAEARRRFPAFTFVNADQVLHDRTGGLIDAAASIAALVRVCLIEGVFIHEHTQVLGWSPVGNRTRIDTSRGAMTADRVVFASGAWTTTLLPQLARRLTVKRQSVGYWPLRGDQARANLGSFPVWAYFGPGSNGLAYGLPTYQSPGLKAAFHETAGAADDPEAIEIARADTLAEVEEFLREQLTLPLAPRAHAETCLYTSTDDEDFVIDVISEDPHLTVLSACSGHGFKFAPLSGRVAANLALMGRSGVAEFESERARFRM